MKGHKKNPAKALDRFFARALKPTREQMEVSRQKVLLRLGSLPPEECDESLEAVREVHPQFRPLMAAAAVAALVLATAGFTMMIRYFARPFDRPGIGRAVAGTLRRATDGEFRSLQADET